MVLIPAGEFWMGSAEGTGNPDERPRRRVRLDAYCLDAHEATNEDYERLDPAHAKTRDWISDRDLSPVVRVSWDDASRLCSSLGKRLPTEAEWERAARGGREGQTYAWGDAPPGGADANYCDFNCEQKWRDPTANDGNRYTSTVGSYVANPYGLYDMAGNVWEWVGDWYSSHPEAGSKLRNPSGPARGTERVSRGGSWASEAADLRSAARSHARPVTRLEGMGFRCAQAPLP